MGKRLKGIRLDSGDMAYLSKMARLMLDNAGLTDCKIIASNSLDEFTISSLLEQGAEIDVFGVGERLITSKSEPVFGGVYKLVAVSDDNNELQARIKISENVEKVTNPGSKTLWRLYDLDTNKAIADVLTLDDEVIDDSKPYTIFNPIHTWKRKEVTNFKAVKLLQPVIINGKVVYKQPSIKEMRDYCTEQKLTLWNEIKRLYKPQTYYVDLSQKLWDLKTKMLNENSNF